MERNHGILHGSAVNHVLDILVLAFSIAMTIIMMYLHWGEQLIGVEYQTSCFLVFHNGRFGFDQMLSNFLVFVTTFTYCLLTIKCSPCKVYFSSSFVIWL